MNVFCTADARNQHLQQEHEGEEYEDIELDGPDFKQRKVQYYLHQVISKCFNLHYLSFKSLLTLHAALYYIPHRQCNANLLLILFVIKLEIAIK